METTRKDRDHRRTIAERRLGVLVPVATKRVCELLAGSAPATVERLTKIDRRQIRRLASGGLRRTHLKNLLALAKWRGIAVEELLAESSRPREMPGAFAVSVRAHDLVERFTRHAPPSVSSYAAKLQLESGIGMLLSYSGWVGALYDGGIPILEWSEGVGARVKHRNVRRLQDRQARFANKLADAIAVLLEPLERDQTSTVNPAQSEAVCRSLFDLAACLDAQAREAFFRKNPGAEDIEFFSHFVAAKHLAFAIGKSG